MELTPVGRRLRTRILSDVDACKLLTPPYIPREFLRTMARQGPFEACRQAVMGLPAHQAPPAFEALWRRGKLGLTVESMVLENEWAAHFESEVKERAKARLDAFGRREPPR
jgi:hypothetical protein